MKNGVRLPAAGGREGLCALFEHLQGWQISQANRADVFSATPVNRDDNDKVKFWGQFQAGQKTLFNRAAGAGVATTSLSSSFPSCPVIFLFFSFITSHPS